MRTISVCLLLCAFLIYATPGGAARSRGSSASSSNTKSGFGNAAKQLGRDLSKERRQDLGQELGKQKATSLIPDDLKKLQNGFTVFVDPDGDYKVQLSISSMPGKLVNATLSSWHTLSLADCSSNLPLGVLTSYPCTDPMCSTTLTCRSEVSCSLYQATFSFGEGASYLTEFGCTVQDGTIFSDDPLILSISRAPSSFLMQMDSGNRRFSYCFPPPYDYSSTGKVYFGKSEYESPSYTPLLNSLDYYVQINSIFVNDYQLQIRNSAFTFDVSSSTGGTLVDMIFPFSLLVPSAYGPLKNAIVDAVEGSLKLSPLPAESIADIELAPYAGLCYNLSGNMVFPEMSIAIVLKSASAKPPGNITLRNPELWFPAFTHPNWKIWCFSIWNASKLLELGLDVTFNVLGTYQLSNLQIDLDLDNMRMGYGSNINCTSYTAPSTASRTNSAAHGLPFLITLALLSMLT